MPTVRAEAGIEASRTHIWRVLADFGGIERRSPVVLRSDSTSEAKEGVGAARHCELAPRGTVEEQVVEWEPERHLGINVDPVGPIAAQRWDFDVTEAGPGVQVSMASRSSFIRKRWIEAGRSRQPCCRQHRGPWLGSSTMRKRVDLSEQRSPRPPE